MISDVVVVGAGPAGIAVVSALRHLRVSWVDPAFTAGRLARLPTVACNTKVDLLTSTKFLGHPLLTSLDGVGPAITQLIAGARPLPTNPDPSKLGWTTLGDCQRVYSAATAGLKADNITCFQGRVENVLRAEGAWSASVTGDDGTTKREILARCVVLATGAEPRTGGGKRAVPLEDAFNIETLRARLAPSDRVAVLGNSHSASIIIDNLRALSGPMDLRVTVFTRRPVRLAEWDGSLGTYRYTSTGLKGLGAVIGRECLASGTPWLDIQSSESFDADAWDAVVDCTGYDASPLPTLAGEELSSHRDEATGRLGPPGLFALGAPWPEPPGRLWGVGLEDEAGFKSEHNFIGFHLFLSRAELVAEEVAKALRSSKL